MKLDPHQVDTVKRIAWQAGDQILSVYNSDDFDVEDKGDGSPLTRADRLAHEHIVGELQKLTPDVPVLSEESSQVAFDERAPWPTFWLVDPLDGTKEFIKRNGEFTVNIALIHQRVPVFGVVVSPVLDLCYCGGVEYGATRESRQGSAKPIRVAVYEGGKATVVASRSHRGPSVDHFLAELSKEEGEPEVRSMGSSLKLCLVAEGAAHVYPRLGPTSEWDTAAAHAVVLGAGGNVVDTDGRPLAYNKESILNPYFVVIGGGSYAWLRHIPDA